MPDDVQDTEEPKAPLFNAFREKFGFDGDGFDTDDAFIDHLGSIAVGRDEEEKRLAELQAELEELKKPKEDPPEKKTWGPPQISETARALMDNASDQFEVDGSGFVKAKDPALAKFAEEINSQRAWRTQVADKLVQSPFEVVRESGLDGYLDEKLTPLQKMLDEIKAEQARLIALRNDDEIHNDLAAHASQLFEEKDGELVRGARFEAYEAFRQQGLGLLGVEESKLTAQQKKHLHEFARDQALKVPVETQEAEPKKTKKQSFTDKAKRNGSHELEDRIASVAARAEREAALDLKNDRMLWDASRDAEAALS